MSTPVKQSPLVGSFNVGSTIWQFPLLGNTFINTALFVWTVLERQLCQSFIILAPQEIQKSGVERTKFSIQFPDSRIFLRKAFLKNWSNCTKIKNWKQRKFETLEPKIKLHFPKLKLFEARKILKQRATVAAALNVLSASLNKDSAITHLSY